MDQIISTLSINDIQGIVKFSRSFTVNINKEGFDKLIKNPLIEQVLLSTINKPVQVSINDSVKIINADKVWELLDYNASGIKICVIDTGVNSSHPYLSGRIKDEF